MLLLTHPQVNLCRSFVVGNYRSCKYGSQCHFAHGQHEQRQEGYGPTPEEAYKSGTAMSAELEVRGRRPALW